ncbi:MAG: hypothetical protein OXG35_20940 [Acidobacteria bacterium]|nr:hypothetical protein [Acidobacteriota bacterium]
MPGTTWITGRDDYHRELLTDLARVWMDRAAAAGKVPAMALSRTPLRPLTIEWYQELPRLGGRHVDSPRVKPWVTGARGAEPAILLDDDAEPIDAAKQAVRAQEVKGHAKSVRRARRSSYEALGLSFSGFPGYNNLELWNWWIADIETRSPTEIENRQREIALAYVRRAVAWAVPRLAPVARVAHCAFHQHESVPHGHLVAFCSVPSGPRVRIRRAVADALAAVEPGGKPDPRIYRESGGQQRRSIGATIKDSFFEAVARPHGFLAGTHESRRAYLEDLLEQARAEGSAPVPAPDGARRTARTIERQLDYTIHALGGTRAPSFWLRQWEEINRPRSSRRRSPPTIDTTTNSGRTERSTPERTPEIKDRTGAES